MEEESIRACVGFLRAHRDDCTELSICFYDQSHDPPLEAFANHAHRVTLLFRGIEDQRHGEFLLSQVSLWEPLLREIEELCFVKSITIQNEPTSICFPVFRQLFQIFGQRSHPNLSKLSLNNIEFCSETSNTVASFLENAPFNLNELVLHDVAGDALRMVPGLRRSKRIERLTIDCASREVCTNIFQGLAAAESDGRRCGLRKILCGYFHNGPADQHDAAETTEDLFLQVSEALQQYLESPNATIQCLAFAKCVWPKDHHLGVSKFARGLIRNTSVTEVEFIDCCYDCDDDNDNGDEALVPYHLGKLVRNKCNLSSLSLRACNFFEYQTFTSAVLEALTRRSSPLRSLTFDIGDMPCLYGYTIPVEVFRALMNGVANSTRLSRLELATFDVDEELEYLDEGEHYLWTVAEFLPSFSIEELHMKFERTPGREQAELDQDEVRLLEAFKNNYSLQRVECTIGQQPWFNVANQARLEFYLERNLKLALWAQNPMLVPRELWSYGIMLALAAGKDSLYRSLLALSAQEVGLKQRGRKRKRPQYYQP